MRRTLCALALVLALGCPMLAREIPSPPAPQPPPETSQEATTDGDITNPPLVEFALLLFALF